MKKSSLNPFNTLPLNFFIKYPPFFFIFNAVCTSLVRLSSAMVTPHICHYVSGNAKTLE